jgi:hypothetical protein
MRAIALAVPLLLPAAARAGEAPVLVAVVIDTSGSLGRGELARTRALVAELIAALPADSQYAVFAFDDRSRLVLPRSADGGAVRAALEALRIGGRYTALNDALYDAARYLRDAPAGRRAILLVTDGRDENSALGPDDALKLAQELPIPVLAVGVGRVEERTLRRIAKLTQGDYWVSASASAAALAERILAMPTPAPEAPPSAAVVSAPPAPSPVPEPVRAFVKRRVPRWALVLAGLLVASAVVLLVLSLRREAPICPRCARPVLERGAFCPACAPTEVGTTGAPPTLFAPLGLEEGLDRTIVLEAEPTLTIEGGPREGASFHLKPLGATSLGRAAANDIVLEDLAVSGEHSRIRAEEDGYVLHDLQSTNGCFVNDRRVTRVALREGDVIQLGETRLRFRNPRRRT